MRLKVTMIREKNPPLYKGEVYVSPSQIAERWRERLASEPEELFICIHLDGRHAFIGYREVSRGTLTGSLVHPREVFKAAILQNAGSVLFVHNHPSGTAKESDEDVAVTRRLAQAGELLGIRVLDHIIIAGEEYVSMSEKGLAY